MMDGSAGDGSAGLQALTRVRELCFAAAASRRVPVAPLVARLATRDWRGLLHWAAAQGEARLAQHLACQFPRQVDLRGALAAAASRGHLAVVQALHQSPAARGVDAAGALQAAARGGHLHVVQALCGAPAPRQLVVDPAADDNAAVCCAAGDNRFHVVRYLAQLPRAWGVDPSARSNYVLRQAVRFRRLADVVRLCQEPAVRAVMARVGKGAVVRGVSLDHVQGAAVAFLLRLRLPVGPDAHRRLQQGLLARVRKVLASGASATCLARRGTLRNARQLCALLQPRPQHWFQDPRVVHNRLAGLLVASGDVWFPRRGDAVGAACALLDVMQPWAADGGGVSSALRAAALARLLADVVGARSLSIRTFESHTDMARRFWRLVLDACRRYVPHTRLLQPRHRALVVAAIRDNLALTPRRRRPIQPPTWCNAVIAMFTAFGRADGTDRMALVRLRALRTQGRARSLTGISSITHGRQRLRLR